MNKFIITERAGGFGDIFTTLMGSWILAKYSNRDVIIDWRRNPYNWYCGNGIVEKKSGSFIPINSFLTIFDVPKNLCGVNFYLPEHIDNYFIRNNEYNFWEYNDLKILSQESKKIDENNKILFSDDLFIRNEIRYGTECLGVPINMNLHSYFDENITLNKFFEHFKTNEFISQKIKDKEKQFIDYNVCGIHIRHGNNTEITNPLRYPNWIDDNVLIDTLKQEIKTFCNNDYKFFISTDTKNINDLILSKIPNSFSFDKEYSLQNESCLLLNSRINPISSFQQSFMDMYFLTKCTKLIYTRASIFNLIPQTYYDLNNKKSIF